MKVHGQYDYDNEIYIGPRSNIDEGLVVPGMKGRESMGFFVITPFKLEDRE